MKKLISLFLCIILMVSSMSIVAFAEEEDFEKYPVFEIDMGSTDGTIDIPDVAPGVSGILEIEVEPVEANTFAANTPPVAGLQYVILNPETLVNGNITTSTQIAWLWSYNGEDFTYDPDGDAITDRFVGGIPSNAVIGYLTGGIGFATQIDTAGQYQMTYQVKDANGALSNIVKVVINVEPANSNTRPVCKIVHNLKGDFLRTEENLIVSWKNSYDNDPGDSIIEVRGMVYKDGSETSQSISSFINNLTADGCSMVFPSVGTYEIWISVSDSNNAWSDWVIFTIRVESGKTVLSNMQLINAMTDTDPGSSGYWVDNYLARSLSDQYSPSEDTERALLELAGTKWYPSGMVMPRVGTSLIISGTLKYTDGAPCVNADVIITMPMTAGHGLKVTVKTDSSGNFSHDMGTRTYWTSMGYIPSTLQVPISGDCTGAVTQFTHYSGAGTSFYYPTTITVATAQSTWKKEVAATAGIARFQIIGKFMGQMYQGSYVWDYI